LNKRTYTKRARAEKENETRKRILDATLAMWAENGPAATTITAVAARAGVQRLTLYRHFGEEAALASAAWSHLENEAPPPDPAGWASVGDPARRTRKALRALYRYYRDNAAVLGPLLRDAPQVSSLADAVRTRERYLTGVIATIEAGWNARGRAKAAMLEATFRHAVRFSTWQSITDAGLADRDAARLIERWIRALARKAR